MCSRNGRILSEPFIKLPSKKDLPDYYGIIKHPMDFKRIKQKLKENKYKSVTEIDSDINLLCTNAQIYNMDGSLVRDHSFTRLLPNVLRQIFEDSIVLQSVWSELTNQYRTENANVVNSCTSELPGAVSNELGCLLSLVSFNNSKDAEMSNIAKLSYEKLKDFKISTNNSELHIPVLKSNSSCMLPEIAKSEN